MRGKWSWEISHFLSPFLCGFPGSCDLRAVSGLRISQLPLETCTCFTCLSITWLKFFTHDFWEGKLFPRGSKLLSQNVSIWRRGSRTRCRPGRPAVCAVFGRRRFSSVEAQGPTPRAARHSLPAKGRVGKRSQKPRSPCGLARASTDDPVHEHSLHSDWDEAWSRSRTSWRLTFCVAFWPSGPGR